MGKLLDRDGIVFLVVDMQDTLLKKCVDWEMVAQRTVVFAKFCHILSVPILMTEQHPKGLGRTNMQVREAAAVEPVPKTAFSCFDEPAFTKALDALRPKALVLAGIEAHICICQTALGAVERGLRAHVLADAVTSRAEWMRDNALARMRHEGVVVSNTESAMYEMMGDSADPLFKRMLFLVK